jgi:membrane protein required for colicin V production
MNALDVGIIVILLLIIVHGAYRGLVRQMFSLGALIAGIIVSGQFYSAMGRLVKPLVLEPILANIVGWVVIFMGVVVLLLLIGGRLHQAVANTELSGANRTAGAIFAAVKGVIIILAGIGILSILITGDNPLMHRSFIVPRALRVLQRVTPVFPVEYRSALEDRLKVVHEEIRRSLRSR